MTGIFSKKQKNRFLDKVNGSMCAKFQVCIIFSLATRNDTNTCTQINTYTSEIRNILDWLLASRRFWKEKKIFLDEATCDIRSVITKFEKKPTMLALDLRILQKIGGDP